METKQDFKIAESQERIMESLRNQDILQLLAQIKKCPELEQELKEWMVIDLTVDQLFELLPNDFNSFVNTKNKIANLLFNREWNNGNS